MSFMKTYNGNKFFVTEPQRTKFDLHDIAHALSNLCRFGGHTQSFYSVAQHSVMVADIVAGTPGSTPDDELWGLFHDATEAYMIDLPTPIKVTLPEYGKREEALMDLLIDALKLPPHDGPGQLPAVVKSADAVALVTEARQLMFGGVSDWSEPFQKITPFPGKIEPLAPEEAKALFLNRFADIKRRRKAARHAS